MSTQLRPEWQAAFRVEFVAAARKLHEALARSARERETARLVKAVEREVAKALLAQGRGLVARLAQVRDRWPVEEAIRLVHQVGGMPLREAFIEDDWGPLWDAAARDGAELLQRAIQAGAKEALAAGAQAALQMAGKELVRLEISWTLENPRAVAYLAAHGAELVTRIDEATRTDLRSLISAAMSEGRTYDQLAGDIITQFKHYGDPNSYWRFDAPRPQAHIDSRAHLIATTELGEAYEDGQWQGMQELKAAGLQTVKWWSTMGDERVSELCAGNEADGEIPIEQAHASGHMHPLGHPACRCTENYDVRLEPVSHS